MEPHPKPGDVVRARVVALAPYGIHLSYEGLEILVHSTDVDWSVDLAPSEYARVGEELDVKILRLVDEGRAAAGWLPPPGQSLPQPVRSRARRSAP